MMWEDLLYPSHKLQRPHLRLYMAAHQTQRYYENRFPKVNEAVVVTVSKLDQMGVFCTLIEYGNVEGYIPTPELSQQRIRKITQVTKIGSTEVAIVLRVDEEKGYIDLSKRRADADASIQANDRLQRSKTVDVILRSVQTEHGIELSKLYETIAWPLARQYGHAYDGFKKALQSTTGASIFGPLNIPEDIQASLMENIKRRMSPKQIKIRAELELKCTSAAGVNAIKKALKAGEQCGADSSHDIKLECKVKATPIYSIETTTLDKEKGMDAILKAINVIKHTLEKDGGTYGLPVPPTIASKEALKEEEDVSDSNRDDDEVSDGLASTDEEQEEDGEEDGEGEQGEDDES